MGCLFCLSVTWFLVVLNVGMLCKESHQLRRDDFPADFVFGAGTSSFQVEGAVAEDGRSPSVWDAFTHAGKMIDKSNADISADQYHKYKEDVKLMRDMGLEAYRFSISWSRLIPDGRGAVNPKGIQYYNNLINELISQGIEPHVTLLHLDLPQVLEDEYEGWLSPRIIDDFVAYADVCFREFGDRVSYWTTINEPNIFAVGAYDDGVIPPEHCTNQTKHGVNCTAGNSSVEPYIVAHHQLLAHAEVYQIYKQKYLEKQRGQVGINVFVFWLTPKTNSSKDIAATERALDFMIGWILHPLVFGDYPKIMKNYVGERLPSFSENQLELVKGCADFIGINHYYTLEVADERRPQKLESQVWGRDMLAKIYGFSSIVEVIGKGKVSFSLPQNPKGLEKSLEYIKMKYNNPPVYVHENGYATPRHVVIDDWERADHLNGYIKGMLNAMRNGSNTRGYFVWSFLDVFEVLFGYQARYGLIAVNFDDNTLRRSYKNSGHWYSDFIKNNNARNVSEESRHIAVQ